MRSQASTTKRRYAFSLRVWLNFLYRIGVSWDRADADVLASFKVWRLSIEDNTDHVVAGSFSTDLAAIRKFYEWASVRAGVDNPVRLCALGEKVSGGTAVGLEASPSRVRRADVKWLTPEAFRLWRNVGLRGFSLEGLPSERWRGRTEDRDVAYAEGLYGTGLRMAEWSSVLTVELPSQQQRGLFRIQLASACAKGNRGRRYWMRRRVLQLAQFYCEEGSRRAAVASAQLQGRYEVLTNRWLLREVRKGGQLRVVNPKGESVSVALDALTPKLRMRLFQEGPGGLEPVWLWLNDNGLPRSTSAWHKSFDRANQRVTREFARAGVDDALWCRPHMLRHSFALRWFCIAKFVAWQRTGLLSEQERRDFRDQLGDVWYLMATLLGHRSPETTREVYLEPFQALDVEELIALMDADDRAALEQLVETVASDQPRVLTAARR